MKKCENHGRGKFHIMVDTRTFAALKEKNIRFADEHEQATDEELVTYVKACAKKLGYTPCMTEIIGGRFIAGRMEGWDNVIRLAELKKPGTAPDVRRRKIYKEEYKRQMHLLKLEIAERREERKNERAERAEHARSEKEARIARDMEWGRLHENESDEELLDYVKEIAGKLGYTPFAREVQGGEYISERFCGWPMVLTCAGLPLPQGMKPPKPAKQAEYNRKKK